MARPEYLIVVIVYQNYRVLWKYDHPETKMIFQTCSVSNRSYVFIPRFTDTISLKLAGICRHFQVLLQTRMGKGRKQA
jgi:hypothetical protein